jgi:hypothetical protein
MLGLLLVVLTVAPVKLAAPGVSCVGLEQGLCDVYLEHFVSVLSADGKVRITTAKDVAQLLGMERERQLLGCSDARGSCIAELAGALGVDGIVSASVAKTDSGFLVNLRVLHAADGSVWVQATGKSSSDDELQSWLDAQARNFESQLAGLPVGGALVRWTPAIAGGVVLVAGGVLFGWSKADAGQLTDSTNGLNAQQLSALAARGKVTQPLGAALMGVGAAGIAASLLWVALAPGAPAQVALVPTPGGAVFTLGGALP